MVNGNGDVVHRRAQMTDAPCGTRHRKPLEWPLGRDQAKGQSDYSARTPEGSGAMDGPLSSLSQESTAHGPAERSIHDDANETDIGYHWTTRP